MEVALDLRYRGQAYELPIPVPPVLDEAALAQAAARFHAEHKARYGFDQPFVPVEVVTLRVTALGRLPKPPLEPAPEEGEDASAAVVAVRPVYFDDGYRETPVYDRSRLRPGNRVEGPALILQADCTTVLHPGQSLRVDGFGNLIIRIAG